MSGSNHRWAELSSENERVMQLSESASASAGCPGVGARSRWAALASQRERLVDATDKEFDLATSGEVSLSLASPGMRLVAGAA